MSQQGVTTGRGGTHNEDSTEFNNDKNIGLPVLLFLALFSGMVTRAGATPYIVSITSPDEYIITGSFDSDLDTWSNQTEITNWSFSATVFQPPAPFNVGPISQAIAGDSLLIFNGSVTAGITNLTAAGKFPTLIAFEEGGVSAMASLMSSRGDAQFDTFREFVKNSVQAVPEPSTALSVS